MSVYIGLGSNLGNPEAQINRGLHAISQLPGVALTGYSALYASRPLGPQDQPDFINAVAEIHTPLAPMTLLYALQAIEEASGRKRTRHWGERTLDLDILLWHELTIDAPALRVPHPGITDRPFVLIPLYEIAPKICLPDGSTLHEHWQHCDRNGIWYHGQAAPRE